MKTTQEEDERIVEAAIFYKFETIAEVMNKIREELNLRIDVSVSTINRRLLDNFWIFRVRVISVILRMSRPISIIRGKIFGFA